ncbi:hypothetical protein HAX54_007705 [Datura stramonium]|uniref:Uncharacterized protein n=1 Tax=Datura stramonium TaxID=4076 RepID=A0ABS8WWX8_DATST|nr:hypothetical protein [Datura stramonium]
MYHPPFPLDLVCVNDLWTRGRPVILIYWHSLGAEDSSSFAFLQEHWYDASSSYDQVRKKACNAHKKITLGTCYHAPHQLMSEAGSGSSTGLHKDFLSKLQVAMLNANVDGLRCNFLPDLSDNLTCMYIRSFENFPIPGPPNIGIWLQPGVPS